MALNTGRVVETMNIRINTLITVLAGWLPLLSGCQTFHPDWSKSWFGPEMPKVKESKYATPGKMAIIWSPAVMNTVGQKPTRGFGGRIYFYDAQQHAVPVEGQLVVYGYDNSKQDPGGKTPDRKYAFTPEQFTRHFSPDRKSTRLNSSHLG